MKQCTKNHSDRSRIFVHHPKTNGQIENERKPMDQKVIQLFNSEKYPGTNTKFT